MVFLQFYKESLEVFRRTDKYELLPHGGAKPVTRDEWVLRVRDVQDDDQGGYTCQVNSNPVLARSGQLTLRGPLFAGF
jgi:hypothetical protein